jgi:hypothetical protein
LSQSVSFILPVRDMERQLRDRVQMILEVLEELTGSFDVMIVDYGSQDETVEVAWDLVRTFPQVDFMQAADGADQLGAIEAGLRETKGEVVFVHDPSQPFGASSIRSLWQLRNDDDLVMAQSRSVDRAASRVVPMPISRRRRVSASSSIQMIRRQAVEPVRTATVTTNTTVDRLTRTDLLEESPENVRLPKLLAKLRLMGVPMTFGTDTSNSK